MLTTFIGDRVKAVLGMAPTDFTSTTSADTAAIQRHGYNTALILVSNSAGTSGTLTLTFFDGANSSPVTAVTFDTTPAVINAAAAGLNLYTVNLSGFNDYFKITVTPALSSNHSYVSVDVLLGDAYKDPAAASVATIYSKA